MHQRGVRMSARILDGEGQELECLAELPRWTEDWQLYYFLEQPIVLEPGYHVEVTCTYDTSAESGPVTPGWGRENEMCFVGLYTTEHVP